MSRFLNFPILFSCTILIHCAPILAQVDTTVTNEIPDGWEKYVVRNRSFVSRSVDQKWVTEAFESQPATQPVVTSVDLIRKLAEKRDLLTATMLADSTKLTPVKIEQFIDKVLVPKIKPISDDKTTIVYYVFTDETLKQAILGGWRSEFFKYNADSDELQYPKTIKLDVNSNGRDLIMPATYNGTDSETLRQAQLFKYVMSVENAVRSANNSRNSATFITLAADFIGRESLDDFSKEDDQSWFTTGLTHVLAIKYLSELTGTPARTLLEAVLSGPLPEGISSQSQNLLVPLDSESIKAEALPGFREARKRKAIAVVFDWYSHGGEARLTEALLAVNRLRPADGVTLVKIIKDVTGNDLTDRLSK